MVKIYRTIILPVVLYGCETWSLTLREERRLRVFENRVLRRVFEPKRDEVTEEGSKLLNEVLNDLYCSEHIIHEECDGRCMWHVHETREVHIGFWRGDLGERDQSEDLVIDGMIILNWIFKIWDRRSHGLDLSGSG